MRFWSEADKQARDISDRRLLEVLEDHQAAGAAEVVRSLCTVHPWTDCVIRERRSLTVRFGPNPRDYSRVLVPQDVLRAVWDASTRWKPCTVASFLAHVRKEDCHKGEVLKDQLGALPEDAPLEWGSWAQGIVLSHPTVRKHLGWGAARRLFALWPLADLHLGAVDLAGVDLKSGDLSRSNLSGACLREAYLLRTLCIRTILKGAEMQGCVLQEAVAMWADLREADLSFSVLNDGNFSETDCRSTNFHEVCAARANFTRADLRGANFNGAYLEGAIFDGAHIAEATFDGAAVKNVDFTQARS